MNPLPIFIGYDPREHLAYEVACHSITRRSSEPVLVSPLYLPNLTWLLTRHIQRIYKDGSDRLYCPISEAPMSTEFAISRFCVPFIQENGWALYLDCDVLCLEDIALLFAQADNRYAVMVVKHDHKPLEHFKMDGQKQTSYPCKNWSSVVLWNCNHEAHRRLTRTRLNTWPGRNLHAFKWLMEDEIGELPADWNYLVGVDEGTEPKLLHYTLGTPDLLGRKDGPLARVWLSERALMRPSESLR